MVFGAATALFAWQDKIQYQMDAIVGAVVMHRMHTPVIDLKQLACAHIDGLPANGKANLVIGDDWQVNTMRVR